MKVAGLWQTPFDLFIENMIALRSNVILAKVNSNKCLLIDRS